MRHQVKGKKLNRSTNHRKALFRTMISQLVLNGYLTTTETKAKLIKSKTEKLINKGKTNTVHVRRQLVSELGNQKAVKQTMDVLAPKLKDQTGGYIKSIRQGRRRGDNVMMVRLELPILKTIEAEKSAKETKVKTDKKDIK